MNLNWRLSPETSNLGQIWRSLEPCDLDIWRMNLKNNRAPLLCCFNLCASFRSHWWIQTGVTVRKRPIWVKIRRFFYDLEIWRMTLKNNRAPLLCYLNFVQHFVATAESKLELQSGNAQSGSNSTMLRAVWPWNLTDELEKTIGHLFYAAYSCVHDFIAICEYKLELESGNG